MESQSLANSCSHLFSLPNQLPVAVAAAQGTDSQNEPGTKPTLSSISPQASEDLLALRKIFGRELRVATSFEIEYVNRDQSRQWHSYMGMELAFMDQFDSYGFWLLRTPDKTMHYTLDAGLPMAKKIAANLLPQFVPLGMSVSQDGRKFVGSKGAHPTPKQLNEENSLQEEKSAAIFVGALNGAMTAMFGGVTSIEFVEFLARGEIPIPLTRSYGTNVEIGRKVLHLAQHAPWQRFRKILKNLVEKRDAVEFMARDRRQARLLMTDAYWLVANNSVFSEGTIEDASSRFTNGLEELERKTQALTPVPNQQTPKAPTRSGTEGAIRAWIRQWNPFANRTNFSQGEEEPKVDSYVWVTIDDLAPFINAWKFEETENSMTADHYFMYWLKGLVTRHPNSSNTSMNSERLVMRAWIFSHFPQLAEIKIPNNLSNEESYSWWLIEATKVVGSRLQLPLFPYEAINEYHQEAWVFHSSWMHTKYNAYFSSKHDHWRGKSGNGTFPEKAFALLRLNENATLEELKATYRNLAKINHPDLHPEDYEAAEERMKDINEAYEQVTEWIMSQNS